MTPNIGLGKERSTQGLNKKAQPLGWARAALFCPHWPERPHTLLFYCNKAYFTKDIVGTTRDDPVLTHAASGESPCGRLFRYIFIVLSSEH